MNTLTLSEFLNIDVKDKSNLDSIFHYSDNFLTEIQAKNFPENKVSILDSIISKYVDCGLNILYNSTELKELKKICIEFKERVTKRNYRSAFEIFIPFIKFKNDNSTKFNNDYNKIYSLFIESYRKIIEDRKYFEFEGYFKPNNTTKDRIKFLILKCIDLIENDSTLKSKAKDKFLKEFETILRQLDSPYANWTIILGKVKQSILVMGALGAIATGAVNVINEIEDVKTKNGKLNETVNILNEIEEEIINSYRVTPDDFTDTFTFGNRLSMRSQKVEFEPLLLELPAEQPKKNRSTLEISDAKILNEEE